MAFGDHCQEPGAPGVSHSTNSVRRDFQQRQLVVRTHTRLLRNFPPLSPHKEQVMCEWRKCDLTSYPQPALSISRYSSVTTGARIGSRQMKWKGVPMNKPRTMMTMTSSCSFYNRCSICNVLELRHNDRTTRATQHLMKQELCCSGSTCKRKFRTGNHHGSRDPPDSTRYLNYEATKASRIEYV